MSDSGTPRMSASEARAAAKAATGGGAKKGFKKGSGGQRGPAPAAGGSGGAASPMASSAGNGGVDMSAASVGASDRTATGILISEKRARDIKISSLSVTLYGRRLLEDSELELNWGQRYGLIGRNGCGKSTLLRCIAGKEIPIPDHIDTYLLAEEAQPSEQTALQYVICSAQAEMARLEALAEDVLAEDGPDSELYMDILDRQSELDPSTFESRASTILVGLGFSPVTIHKRTCDMSGGWRMRVALARALFVAPALLLLDEPTNHLDLEACVWLEEYLAKYTKIVVVISHSQDFLNGVCSNMIVMQQQRLKLWSGNFDMYVQTRTEQDRNQLTLFKKQQEEIAHIKAFIASCGTYANLVRQAKSREKQLNKMIEDGLLTEPFVDAIFRFNFPETVKMPPPLISFSDVSFSYSGKAEDFLFTGLRFGIDSDSRIALVGPNGAGKSTLLKLMVGENAPCVGNVSMRAGVSIGRYHQHSAEVLDKAATPVEYISRKFHDRYPEKKEEDWRGVVGGFGIPSEYHLLPIDVLSEGLKTRLVFCEIALNKPHILLLDEPTNAADMEMIDSMAAAINNFKGGLVLISHDFRLLQQVGGEIWLVDRGIKKWDGDIKSYKAHLKRTMASANK